MLRIMRAVVQRWQRCVYRDRVVPCEQLPSARLPPLYTHSTAQLSPPLSLPYPTSAQDRQAVSAADVGAEVLCTRPLGLQLRAPRDS
jgi:hypothetical protein